MKRFYLCLFSILHGWESETRTWTVRFSGPDLVVKVKHGYIVGRVMTGNSGNLESADAQMAFIWTVLQGMDLVMKEITCQKFNLFTKTADR